MDINFNNWIRVTLICPNQAPKSIKVQKPIHILCLPPAYSATSQHFHLPPRFENHQMKINISLNTANLNTMNISSPEFWVWQHLEDHWNKTQLHKLADIHTVPVAHLCKHMIDNNRPIHPFNIADESTDDTGSIWTLIFSHRDLCYRYRIASTSRTRDILLLLFLVLTYHASMPTFTIRFYLTYFCGWGCRGSTHLQKWQPGWTSYSKTSQES